MASNLIIISEQIHATAVELYGNAILLRESPDEEAKLISDDRVELTYKKSRVYAGSPENINGIIEVRGVGLLEVGFTGLRRFNSWLTSP